MTFTVRAMQMYDVPDCVVIINHTISLGGSTAHEEPYNASDFAAHYFEDAEVANVVLHGERIVGFQGAFEVESGVYSIGSFTDQMNPVRGAGKAMFEKTRVDCKNRGGTSIIAKITEDNSGGLAFYSKMGFQPDHVKPADHTRPNGTQVDRIVKRFVL
ncbi:L-amino acid N-acyltransferase YncA [Octadecabacter temperatus]|uniref:Uncharacterized protein n=1 Tax=Octadecabacter temperatus TaxID=1458307 RepID=A0A0K0YA33_9RHOB|nr:GNAT family N-acetyltransferase [Octadecabacter temperatus]AKS47747.1 hypothetical protein OSB_32340 [Octadecabacter temperatus]SIO39043.1 L-amino acid N-acyltransferase YncA [Octadecabacter temperatus]